MSSRVCIRLRGATHLGQLLLAAATADAHAVDAKALLGLVAQVARLLGARRARGTVDDRKLAVLPAAHAEQEADGVRLLLAPDLLEVLEGALRKRGGRGRSARRQQTSRFWLLLPLRRAAHEPPVLTSEVSRAVKGLPRCCH